MLDKTKLEAVNVKWPQCVITGKPVTKEQAREILIKTDMFFTWTYPGGNDIGYSQLLRQALGMPPVYDFHNEDKEATNALFKANEQWREEHNCLSLNHFDNNWISSCYIGGPKGWCHIDGTIGRNTNIGKWADWDEVIEDLEQLGKAFPFLDIEAHLIDCESGTGWDEEDKDQRVYLGGIHLVNGELENAEPIDPFSEICEAKLDLSYFSTETISDALKKEVASVVTPVEHSCYESRCANEQIFKIEEAIEYFGKV